MPIGAFKLNSIAKYSAPAAVARTASTVTAFNQAQISTAQYKFNLASAVFDGNNDYLTATTTASDSSGALTLEAWVRFDILPTSQTLGGGNYMMLATIGSDSYVLIQNTRVQVAVSGAYYSFTIPTIAINTWYHVAVVRESNNDWFVYWDGVKKTGTVDAGDTDVNKSGNWLGTSLTIGRFIDTRGSWDGFIDEFRLSKSARYTATFTPSTTPFVNDSNTVLLLHMDGTNASTYFEDDVGVNRTRRNGSVQSTGTISTSQAKFGSSSFGTTGRIIVDRPALTDWTFECWTYQTARGNVPTVFGDYISFYIDSSGYPGFYSGGNFSGSIQVSLNTWNHIAWTRTGTSFKIWVNGSLAGTWTNSVSFPAYSTGIGGYSNDNSFNWVTGYIDEIRISDIARYSATFTPSSTAFTNDSNTIVLYHLNGTNASTTIIDDNN